MVLQWLGVVDNLAREVASPSPIERTMDLLIGAGKNDVMMREMRIVLYNRLEMEKKKKNDS